jgi:hypothetical protein
MSHAALVDELANELATWPGVRVERRAPDVAVVSYEQLELGVLDRSRGLVELPASPLEHDELVEHGDAEAATPLLDAETIRHDVHGPSDVTAALALFDRRYRDVRGEDDPYSSEDPG